MERPIKSIDDSQEQSAAWRYQMLRQFGDFTLAYGIYAQPVISYFETDQGYLGYARKWGYTFVLGDPVADKSDWSQIVASFMKSFRRPCFIQASQRLAEIVSQYKRYYVNEMGYDTLLHLGSYDFAGKTKEKLRYAANWLKRRDYEFKEFSGTAVPISQIESVSSQWRQTRTVKKREVVFLNRPLVAEHEKDVRKFFLLDRAGQLVSFAFYDPLYRDDQVVGYTTVIKRRRPDSPVYAETGLTKTVIEQFKAEGKELVTLGLSPLAGLSENSFKANPFLSFSWKRGFNAKWVNRFFYNLKGHAQFKNHFHGNRVQTYFCSPDLFNDLRMIAMLRLMRVF